VLMCDRILVLASNPGRIAAEIPVPLVAEFPFPAWATRLSERGANPAATGAAALPDDPFTNL